MGRFRPPSGEKKFWRKKIVCSVFHVDSFRNSFEKICDGRFLTHDTLLKNLFFHFLEKKSLIDFCLRGLSSITHISLFSGSAGVGITGLLVKIWLKIW